MSNWIVLGEYLDKDALVKTEAILSGNQIQYQIQTPESHLNSALGQGTSQPFIIEVQEDQYESARQLVFSYDDESATQEMSMSDYSEEELKEMVLNPDDWHPDFVSGAKKELSKRGTEVNEADVKKTRDDKISQDKAGTEPKKALFYVMWLLALAGGYIGLIAGYYYWQGKARGTDGNRYYIYTKKYRTLGSYMFLSGLISILIQVIYFLRIY